MNPIRRELLNGLFVLVLSTLLSAGFAAFQVKFDVQLWVWIIVGTALAVGGYVVFEFVLSNQEGLKKTEQRELEWLKRVGTPARLGAPGEGLIQAIKNISPGSDYTALVYVSSEGGAELPHGTEAQTAQSREDLYRTILEQVKQGRIREYKRIVCFDQGVLANDPELRSGILRVGEGPGTINRQMGEHCRLMMKTKGCSLYVAPAVFRSNVFFYGVDQVSLTVETAEQEAGGRSWAGSIFFCDPPNGEIIEQFRQMERETERRMVAVHKIVFPEDESSAAVATR